MKFTDKLIEAVAVALEVTGTEQLSDGAVKVMLHELSTYPEQQVLAALRRCIREVKGKLTLADILLRIEDGRPAPEEAWSMVPKDEGSSVFWTSEMRDAYAIASTLVSCGELVQGRMAFLERYRAIVLQARTERVPVQWEFSPGHDAHGRELALLDAVQKGRLAMDRARELLPYRDEALTARLFAAASNALPAPATQPETWKAVGRLIGAKTA